MANQAEINSYQDGASAMALPIQEISLSVSKLKTLGPLIAALKSESLIKQLKYGHALIIESPISLQISLKPGRLKEPPIDLIGGLVYLARAVAEAHGKVLIIWPTPAKKTAKNKIGRFEYSDDLEALLLPYLFGSTAIPPDVGSRIKIRGRSNDSVVEPIGSSRQYLPFNWLDSSSYKACDDEDYLAVSPKLHRGIGDRLIDQVGMSGFLKDDASEGLVKTALLEIGWNSVIHSQDKPGKGYALLFGALKKEIQSQTSLHFWVMDMGLGICNTLGHIYGEIGKERYRSSYRESLEMQILAFSLDEDGTRRTTYPSKGYERSFRGLKMVANEIGARGVLRLSSGEGAFDIQATTDANKAITITPSPQLTPLSYPGVLIFGQVMGGDRQKTVSPHSMQTIELDITRSTTFRLEELLQNPKLAQIGIVTLIDTNFESDAKTIGELFVALSYVNHIGDCLLVNHAISEKQFQSIRNVALKTEAPGLRFFFWQEDGILTAINSAPDPTSDSFVKNPILELATHSPMLNRQLSVDNQLEIIFRINCAHLNEVGQDNAVHPAMYFGRIHTLSGRVIKYYYSFARDVEVNGSSAARRWSSALRPAINHFLLSSKRNPQRIVLIGFCGAIARLVVDIGKTSTPAMAAIGVMSFELPERQDFREHVDKYNSVILITDVISSGSLAREMIELVQKADLEVLGVITLVDGLVRGSRAQDTVPLNPSIPLVRCSCISLLQHHEQHQDDYWVDPLTHELSHKEPREPIEYQNIRQSLDILKRSTSINIGRTADGTRVSSIYVEVSRLVEELEQSGNWNTHVIRIIENRLKHVGWKENFRPTVVLSPSAIDRLIYFHPVGDIVKISQSHATAAKRVGQLLRHHFRIEAEVIEVPRIVDAGGRAIIAVTALTLPDWGPSYDAVIADDGMTTGETIITLAKYLVEQGAQRVLAVPLLARLEARNLVTIAIGPQKITQFSSQENAELVYALPLIYPVPFYTKGTDPFEQTRNRLRRHLGATYPMNLVAENLINMLDYVGQHDKQSRFSEEFQNTFVELRAYCSLALDSHVAMESLINKISSVNSMDSLNACMHLFLEEWNLVKQSGLRQRITGPIHDMAVRAIQRADCSDDLAIQALSLIRTILPSKYEQALSMVRRKHLLKAANYKRVCFHLFTLPLLLRRSQTIRANIDSLTKRVFLERILENALYNEEQEVFACALLLKAMLSDVPEIADISSTSEAIYVLNDFYRSGERVHELKYLVNTLIANTEHPRFGDSQPTRRWRDFLIDWKKQVSRIHSHVLPALRKLGPALASVWSHGEVAVLDESVAYFADFSSGENLFGQDLLNVTTTLEFLLQGGGDTFAKLANRSLSVISERMYDNVVKDKSVLQNLLAQIAPTSLQTFLLDLDKAVRLGLGMEEINVGGTMPHDLNVYAVLPQFLRERLKTMIIGNLQIHAFEKLNRNSRTKKIEIENFIVENVPPRVSIWVRNNGKKVDANKTGFTSNSQEIKGILAQFGGSITEVEPLSGPIWRCQFKLELEIVRHEPTKLIRGR